MITDLPCERLRAQRSARLLIIAAFLLFSFDGHAQAAATGQSNGRREVESPPFDAPPITAPAATREENPAAKPAPPASAPLATAPSAPAPQLASEPRLWPALLAWTAGGVELLGASLMAGGFYTSRSEIGRAQRTNANVATKGCGSPACDTFVDASTSADTASAVGELGFALCTLVASGLLSVGIYGWASDPSEPPAKDAPTKQPPVKIEAAPTVGGLVFRGTF